MDNARTKPLRTFLVACSTCSLTYSSPKWRMERLLRVAIPLASSVRSSELLLQSS